MTISKFLVFSFLVASFVCSTGCKSKQLVTGTQKEDNYSINFIKSDLLMPVLEQAENEDKMVFLDFYTTWCTPCKLMDEDVFTDREIGKYFNENFLSMKIDAESEAGSNLAGIFEVKAYPTLIFLNKKGVSVVRKEGVAFHSALKNMAQEALKTKNPN